MEQLKIITTIILYSRDLIFFYRTTIFSARSNRKTVKFLFCDLMTQWNNKFVVVHLFSG